MRSCKTSLADDEPLAHAGLHGLGGGTGGEEKAQRLALLFAARDQP